ncbi:hypothetical protein V6N13_029966 [Hibiscus sabdariffa]|uniref:Uncharacterized protein n=2 Tax=Hibiscus sabdariffa TaxID=183260 RepID=A0ABR1Z9N4_9ROSI
MNFTALSDSEWGCEILLLGRKQDTVCGVYKAMRTLFEDMVLYQIIYNVKQSNRIEQRTTGGIFLNPGIVEYNGSILGFGNETPSVNIITEAAVQGLQSRLSTPLLVHKFSTL